MQISVIDIRLRVLHKLIRWNKWGGSHTENILGGLPGHLKGSKMVDQALKELVRDEWLLPAKKTGEVHYSLNPKKVDEIMRFYQKYCKNF